MPLKVVPRRDRKLHRFVKKGEELTLQKGDLLYSQGDGGGQVYLVRSGHLRLFTVEGSGEERTVGLAGPWELTGEEGLVPGVRRTGARAGETAQIVVLDGRRVGQALRTATKTLDAFLLAKEEDLTLARTLADLRRPGGASLRLAALLVHLARRLGREEDAGTRIPLRLTHQILADLARVHRSNVTTQLNDWIYDGILRQEDGFLTILRPEALAPDEASVDPKSRKR